VHCRQSVLRRHARVARHLNEAEACGSSSAEGAERR
jgi:hypothetical protein